MGGGGCGEVGREYTWNGNETAYLQIPQCPHPHPLNASLRGAWVQKQRRAENTSIKIRKSRRQAGISILSVSGLVLSGHCYAQVAQPGDVISGQRGRQGGDG